MTVGAYAVERDHSHYISRAFKTTLAVVGTATKGPIGEAITVTSAQDLVNKFGPLKTDCFALYAGQYFLSQASKLYFVRAASESASPASLKVVGLDAGEGNLEDSLSISLLESGTYGNGYKLDISENEDNTYNIKVRNNRDSIIESIENVALDKLVVGYTSNYISIKSTNPQTVSLESGTYIFAGGNDGIEDITAADYIKAAESLASESVDINLISTPGISDASVINALLAIAETRGDCLYLVDPPKGLERDGVRQWRNGEGGTYQHAAFNSNYGALYYDWITIYDSVNKEYVKVPPSVVVGATYAYSDRVSELWYAPAGLTRGVIRGAISTESNLTKGDVDLLYEDGINPIYEDPQVGLVVWGQKTLYKEDTALNRVNVRRLMNYLKKVVTSACKYLVFEPNDRLTWNSFEMKVIPTLESIKNRRGIYGYRIVKGESIVTDEDIDNYRMPGMIMVRPTKAAEEIPIYFVITSTGADFNEVLNANGIV